MRKSVWRGLAAGLLVLSGGCHLVLGLDEYTLVEASCSDGTKNGDETGKDCGGSCGPCPEAEGCQLGPDCESKVCSAGTCVAPSCADQVHNGSETDVDCGGSCGGCGPDRACEGDGDCAGGSCVMKVCAATCSDGVKNGSETSTDCGGSECGGCPLGEPCGVGPDCGSGVCKANACVDSHVWSKQFGDSTSHQRGSRIAINPMGQVHLTGWTDGAIDLGGGALQSSGPHTLFAAKLGPGGEHVWSKVFPGANLFNQISGIAADSLGNVVLTGNMAGMVDFGGGPISSGSNAKRGAFIAELNQVGQHTFSHYCGTGSNGNAIAVSKTGNIFIITGDFSGTIDCGGGQLTSSNGSTDIFVMRLSSGGNTVPTGWRFGDDAEQWASSVAVDGSNNIVLAGTFSGALDFGGGPLVAVTMGDAFVAKLTTGGSHVWSKRFDPLLTPLVSADDAGNVVLASQFSGSVDVGGGALNSAGGNDILVTKLDPLGNHLWSKRFGDAGAQTLAGLTVDDAGNVLITGNLGGTVDFGGGPMGGPSNGDVFVVKLDPAGDHLWSRSFGDPQTVQQSTGIGGQSKDSVLLTGDFNGSLDFGGGLLTSPASFDIFLTRLLTP